MVNEDKECDKQKLSIPWTELYGSLLGPCLAARTEDWFAGG